MKRFALLAVLALFAGCGDDAPDTVGEPSPTESRNLAIVATIPTGDGPIMLAASSTSLWVELHREDTVSRIDPETNEEVEKFTDKLYAHCQVLPGANDDIWLSIAKRSYVTRIDGTTGAELDRVVVRDACSLALDGDAVWVVGPGTGDVSLVRPGEEQESETHRVAKGLGAVALVEDALWFSSEGTRGTVLRMDRATHQVTKAASDYPFADVVVAGSTGLWVSSRQSNLLWKADPTDGRLLESVEVRRPSGILEHDGRLWVTTLDGELITFDPATLDEVSRTNLGYVWLGPPVFAFDSLWVAALEDNVVLRVDPELLTES
ncbi:MAG TPA: hypothetical protein VFK52_05790 [Nocardioidaceae bacterium]|nr:hypothetical protein [Nocardioidaceae bacterium]